MALRYSLSKGSGLLAILEKNPKRLNRIKFLGKLFEAGGFELRIAGGAVRDILRGKEPKDIDFATTAKPEESLNILKLHEDVLRIIITAAGQKHGTVAVKFKEVELDLKRIKLVEELANSQIEKKSELDKKPEYDDESPYEITTLRCDKFTDGRHAEVVFINDWQLDAERRDLTMNAMFLTLDEGKLIDYFDGESDLKNGIVRFVGDADKRLKEDYLRILRFFRFWSRYGRGNRPDTQTLETIRKNLDGLDIISGERIWQEIKKIFLHYPCSDVVELMLDLDLFRKIGFTNYENGDREKYKHFVLSEIRKVQQNVQDYSNNYVNSFPDEWHQNGNARKIQDLLPTILIASAFQTSEMCSNACKRLKFSNLERDSMLYIIENRSKKPELKELKKQLAKAHTPDVPHILNKIRAFLIYYGQLEMTRELDLWKLPQFPLTGNIVAKEVKKRNLNRNKIRFVMDNLKDEWAEKDYIYDESALVERMNEILDKPELEDN